MRAPTPLPPTDPTSAEMRVRAAAEMVIQLKALKQQAAAAGLPYVANSLDFAIKDAEAVAGGDGRPGKDKRP